MAQANVNGVRLHLQAAGEGPDIVLVHGIAANIAFWYPRIAPRLARDRRVTLYDLRGHGMSEMPERGYTPADMADDLRGLLDHQGIERADLVGHSFGGAVCLEFAARHPERVRSLTLADATVQALQPIDSGPDWAYWTAYRQKMEELGVHLPQRLPKVAFGLLEELAEPARRGARPRRGTGELFVPFGRFNGARRTAGRWLKLLRTTAAWSELQEAGIGLTEINRIRHPTLLIYGERSRWLRTCQDLGEALPHAETAIVPGAGHFFPLLKPVVFLTHLNAFLERTGQAVPTTSHARAGQ
jgi:pimeloyl-ACP methyl ester carboxylesterase